MSDGYISVLTLSWCRKWFCRPQMWTQHQGFPVYICVQTLCRHFKPLTDFLFLKVLSLVPQVKDTTKETVQQCWAVKDNPQCVYIFLPPSRREKQQGRAKATSYFGKELLYSKLGKMLRKVRKWLWFSIKLLKKAVPTISALWCRDRADWAVASVKHLAVLCDTLNFEPSVGGLPVKSEMWGLLFDVNKWRLILWAVGFKPLQKQPELLILHVWSVKFNSCTSAAASKGVCSNPA